MARVVASAGIQNQIQGAEVLLAVVVREAGGSEVSSL